MKKYIFIAVAVAIVLIGGIFLMDTFRNEANNTNEITNKSISDSAIIIETENTTIESENISAVIPYDNQSAPENKISLPIEVKESDDTPPLLLEGIGVELDYYNESAGKAGDFV